MHSCALTVTKSMQLLLLHCQWWKPAPTFINHSRAGSLQKTLQVPVYSMPWRRFKPKFIIWKYHELTDLFGILVLRIFIVQEAVLGAGTLHSCPQDFTVSLNEGDTEIHLKAEQVL